MDPWQLTAAVTAGALTLVIAGLSSALRLLMSQRRRVRELERELDAMRIAVQPIKKRCRTMLDG